MRARHCEKQAVEVELDAMTDERLEWMRKKDYEAVDGQVLSEVCGPGLQFGTSAAVAAR